LGGLGDAGGVAGPILRQKLKDDDAGVRKAAAAALGAVRPDAKEVAPALLAVAGADPDEAVRRAAGGALDRIGVAGLPQLRAGLNHEDGAVRRAAAEALGRLGPAAADSGPGLTEALRDKDRGVRTAAAESLGRLGDAAGAAGPVLRDKLKDEDVGVRKAAADALRRLGAAAAERPLVEKYLHAGQLADGEKALVAALEKEPKDDQARFGLGMLQFLRAVERLAQSLHRYGVRSDRGQRMNIPLLRLPVPNNPKPEKFTYADARKIVQNWIDDLQKADDTLAAIQDDEVKLPLRLGPIRLDLAGDGKPDDSLTTLISRYMGGINTLKDKDLLVGFDRGDVAWLRGYCHLNMALGEAFLAHDGQELFDCTAHLFFVNVDTPHKVLTEAKDPRPWMDVGDGVDLVDLIAFVHLIRLPVKEPERMKAALTHLEKMLALSKESWKYIVAETDDDHEWIPNPQQKGVLGVPVSKEMVESWLDFVDETEALLAGKRLVPMWRGREERGVNLRKVFTEPRTFDLVLWVQGTGVTPYLEKGELTKPAVWTRLQRVFGGNFFGFAIWFN
jgi:hypothetical protein